MSVTDATLIQRPALTGRQQVEGLWFPGVRFTEAERARLILRHWQAGASAWRFAEGDLLRFGQPQTLHCESLSGWPLVRQGRTLSSAALSTEEVRQLPAADLWLVRGSQVSALRWRDGEALDPSRWIDVGSYTLLDTEDCRMSLVEPVLDPLAVSDDVREILGNAVGPASPEREAIMRALVERQRNAPPAPVPRSVAQPAGAKEQRTWSGAGSGGVVVGLIALFHLLKDSRLPDALTPVVDPATWDIGGLLLRMVLGTVVVTLLLWGLSKLLRREPSVGQVQAVETRDRGQRGPRDNEWTSPRAAPVQEAPRGWVERGPSDGDRSVERPEESAIPPRAIPASPRPILWRRLLSRLTLGSRLSRIYGRRQAAYMRRMLSMFENGDLQEALRHAIPLGNGNSVDQAFGTPKRRDDLGLSRGNGVGVAMLFEEGMDDHLRKLYRKSFERLDREGRVEEAVFVLAELLKAREEALDYLEKHGRHQQAADLALAWDMRPAIIVRLLCLADDWQRALLVARRDDAFADAVMMLQEKWPASADRLRLEWAESLAGKGFWLEAVEVLWSLPGERGRAGQWLLDLEKAGGRLVIGALVKRAVLLPDTLEAYRDWIEQLRDDPGRVCERAHLAEVLLQHKKDTRALAWLAGATVHAIVADQAGGHGRLSHAQLQGLVKMSRDKLLLADLPGKALLRQSRGASTVESMLEWLAPEMGSRDIVDAVPLDDERYLLALGEAGAAVVDGSGRTLFHFPVPAQVIVQSGSRQVALVLARRDEVWRVSKLDLVNRTAKDLGVLMIDVFARHFDGSRWTIGRGQQVRVVDVDHGLETLWHVSDLPGQLLGLTVDGKHEYLWLAGPQGGAEVWQYRVSDRALLGREPVGEVQCEGGQWLFWASGNPAEFQVIQPQGEAPRLMLDDAGERTFHDLFDIAAPITENGCVEPFLAGPWLVISYAVNGQERRVQFIHRNSERVCAELQWPGEVRIREVGGKWMLFDRQGRLCHVDLQEERLWKVSVR